MTEQPVIDARNLSIDYRIGKRWLNAVHNVDLTINPLQIHGLVGESGSGKSTLGLAMMRYLAGNARISSGQIIFNGEDIAHKPLSELRRIWGRQISLVPQNPLDSLNPSLTIQEQMIESTQLHLGLSRNEAVKTAIAALESVKIADPQDVIRRYPHQLSGGMQQRVMIAQALSTRPRLLILDEPTTALDVTTQATILDLIRELIKEENAAALYVSHDLGTVAQLCDYVTVLYAGEIMESAPVAELFAKPVHPYTTGLLGSLPSANAGHNARLATIDGVAPSLAERPSSCVFSERCPVAIDQCFDKKPPLENFGARMGRCWRRTEILSGDISPRNIPQGVFEDNKEQGERQVLSARGVSKRFGELTLFDRLTGKPASYVQAVQDVSVRVSGSMTLGLVGESGSGKTTLARAIAALYTADQGDLQLAGHPVSLNLAGRTKDDLRNLRMIFQNPNDALNPYLTVGQTIGRTYEVLSKQDKSVTRKDIQERVATLLKAVGLTEQYAGRYPNQLSGGEKQRVAIARAFSANPALIVADEPTSSLDVSVQATILNLLKDLRAREGVSYIMISHDLEVISYVSDWIVVMYLGEVMEQGPTAEVYEPPMHPYTEALLSAIPLPDPEARRVRIRLDGDVPSPRHKPTGCPFHTRCPRFLGDVCVDERPPVRVAESGHEIRCHIPLDELRDAQIESLQASGHLEEELAD